MRGNSADEMDDSDMGSSGIEISSSSSSSSPSVFNLPPPDDDAAAAAATFGNDCSAHRRARARASFFSFDDIFLSAIAGELLFSAAFRRGLVVALDRVLGDTDARFSSAHRRALALDCCFALDDIFVFVLVAVGERDGEEEISIGDSIVLVEVAAAAADDAEAAVPAPLRLWCCRWPRLDDDDDDILAKNGGPC